MKKRTRSILEELSSFRPRQHSDEFIQTTGNNIIESAINLLSRIHETYDTQTALDLERRFLNSIRAGNPKKFRSGVDKIIESKSK
jgi:predicted secreted Zn-dependent protease